MEKSTKQEGKALEKLQVLISQLDETCAELNIPVLVVFQDGNQSFKTLNLGDQSKGQAFHLPSLLMTSSTDTFLAELIQSAQKNGHSSLILKAMGIPGEAK